MNNDELVALILGKAKWGNIRKNFENLDSQERRALSKTAQRLAKQLSPMFGAKMDSSELEKYNVKLSSKNWENAYKKSQVAVYATAPLSGVKRIAAIHDLSFKYVLSILEDRKPDWLGDWLQHEISQDFVDERFFPIIRSWTRDGLIERPQTDEYYALFADYLANTQWCWKNTFLSVQQKISEQLLQEPDLLEDAWSIFRVESRAFSIEQWIKDNRQETRQGWGEAIVELVQEGHMDRHRSIEALLHGLSLDFKVPHLAGLLRLHKALTLTPEELLQNQNSYIELMNSSRSQIAKLSLDMLSKIHRQPDFNRVSFLQNISAVFGSGVKGNAVKALKLIVSLIKSKSQPDAETLGPIIDGLRHPSQDVQSMALKLLEANKHHLDEENLSILGSCESLVAVSLRKRVLELSGETYGDNVSSVPASNTTLTNRINTLPEDLREAWGLDELVRSKDLPYSAISDDILKLTVLHTVDRLQPIDTSEELVRRIAKAIENTETADETELIIDAMSRIKPKRDTEFRELTEPLINRLQEDSYAGINGLLAGWYAVDKYLFLLLLTWLTGKAHEGNYEESDYDRNEKFWPLNTHLQSLSIRISKDVHFQRLCTPTHQNGWIDPDIWVHRLLEANNRETPPDQEDLCYSLLRLAPDNRLQAAAKAKTLDGFFGRVANFTLGNTDTMPSDANNDYAVWICAARARSPYGDLREMMSISNLDVSWPDALLPAEYKWSIHKRYDKYCEEEISIFDLNCIGSNNRVNTATGDDPKWHRIPCAVLSMNQELESKYFSGKRTPLTHMSASWLTTLWPLKPCSSYFLACEKIVERMDMKSSNFEHSYGLLYGLFQKNRPWQEIGHLLVALALNSREAEVHALSVEAVIEGVEAGQYKPYVIGEILGRFGCAKNLKFNRMKADFIQIASMSNLHAWVVQKTLEELIKLIDVGNRNLGGVLEAVLEAHTLSEVALNEDVIQKLQTLKGSSKSAKIAKKLCAISATKNGAIQTIRLQALEARLQALPSVEEQKNVA